MHGSLYTCGVEMRGPFYAFSECLDVWDIQCMLFRCVVRSVRTCGVYMCGTFYAFMLCLDVWDIPCMLDLGACTLHACCVQLEHCKLLLCQMS